MTHPRSHAAPEARPVFGPFPGVALAIALALVLPVPARAQEAVVVRIETTAGAIEVALEPARAPGTVANFLRYVDEGLYDGGRFHRAVRLDNQARQDVRIEVVQGGRDPSRARARPGFGPIPLERTSVTGLRHVDGAISMARGTAADSASSDFFICVGDQPSLDFGGARAADGQGFAAFGRVVSGMDVVRAIQRQATNAREQLLEPVSIVRVTRDDRVDARTAGMDTATAQQSSARPTSVGARERWSRESSGWRREARPSAPASGQDSPSCSSAAS